MMIRITAILAALLLAPAVLPAATFNVKEYGATGDGRTMDTAALQSAIDVAAKAGGGIVLLPPGKYLSGSLYLKSHVTLRLDEGATLAGSPRLADYRKLHMYALLLAEKQEEIAICGQGTIDGQGRPLNVEAKRLLSEGKTTRLEGGSDDLRPCILNFRRCNQVTVRDVTLKDSACWVQDYLECDNLTIENIKVRSNAAYNNDGLDIDGCRQVVVRGCDVDSEDDGICLKSRARICEDVLVEDCRVRSSCNALKLGTGSVGGFKNITCRNLEIYDTYHSGIALEIVDGGVMENVQVSHVTITNTSSAIFVRLGHRNTQGEVGKLRGVTIRDVTAEIPDRPKELMNKFPDQEHAYKPVTLVTSSITGQPGHPVQDVTLENITLIFGGIGKSPKFRPTTVDQYKLLSWQNLAEVPEKSDGYPDAHRFGILPAWGFYCRHAAGIKFKNVTLRVQGQDYRPALVCDDVQNLELDGFHVKSAGSEPVIVLNDVKGAVIRNSPVPPGASPFVKTTGNTKDVYQP